MCGLRQGSSLLAILRHKCTALKWILPSLYRDTGSVMGLGTACMKQNTTDEIYIKLTWFKDNDGRKLPFKYYLLRCCSFWEISAKISHPKFFVSVRQKLFKRIDGFLQLSLKRCSHQIFTLLFSKTCQIIKLKLLQINFITYIHLH